MRGVVGAPADGLLEDTTVEVVADDRTLCLRPELLALVYRRGAAPALLLPEGAMGTGGGGAGPMAGEAEAGLLEALARSEEPISRGTTSLAIVKSLGSWRT